MTSYLKICQMISEKELLLRKFQSLDSLKIKTLMEAIHMVSKVLMALIKLKQDIRQGKLRANMPIMTLQVDYER